MNLKPTETYIHIKIKKPMTPSLNSIPEYLLLLRRKCQLPLPNSPPVLQPHVKIHLPELLNSPSPKKSYFLNSLSINNKLNYSSSANL